MTDIPVEHIYSRLACGGIGNMPVLLRYKGKYYTIQGDESPDEYKKLADLWTKNRTRKNGWSLWLRHSWKNTITAKEFLKIIRGRKKKLKKERKGIDGHE